MEYFVVSELGSGQFGMVWLADAIGISAFRPRDMLKERAGGRGLSSLFDRTAKRNNYIYCKEITQVAVKTVKGLTILMFCNHLKNSFCKPITVNFKLKFKVQFEHHAVYFYYT